MKRIIVMLFVCMCAGVFGAAAQSQGKEKVYCEAICSYYNMMKDDLNVQLDFGIADDADDAFGWIYNTKKNKKYSFASSMSVIAYMARHGWEYRDTVLYTSEGREKRMVHHIIFMKELPTGYSEQDLIGDIDYRR